MGEAKSTVEMVEAGQVAPFDLAKAWDAQMVRGSALGLTSPKAMGGSAFGSELPADRMEALVDVLRAKTPAGRMLAIEAGIRAGHVTLAEALEWMGVE